MEDGQGGFEPVHALHSKENTQSKGHANAAANLGHASTHQDISFFGAPQNHIRTRILQLASKEEDKEDSKNHGL